MEISKLPRTSGPVFLIDLSWVLYRSAHVFREESFYVDIETGAGKVHKPTGHLFGMLKILVTIKRSYPDAIIFFCEDGCPVDRILSTEGVYKDNRDSTVRNKFSFDRDTQIMHKLVQDVPNTYFAYHPRMEADDLIYSLSRVFDRENYQVFIYSGDNDLLQSITPNVRVVRSIRERGYRQSCSDHMDIIDEDSDYYREHYPVSPSVLPYFRAIIGDSSDNIKAVSPRFPRDLAVKVAHSICAGQCLNRAELRESHQKHLDSFNSNISVYDNNLKLMKLQEVEVPIVDKDYKPGTSLKTAEEFRLTSFVKYLYGDR